MKTLPLMLAVLLLATATARAEEEPTEGRIPLLTFGVGGNTAMVPYEIHLTAPDGTPGTVTDSEQTFGLLLEARLRIDLDVLVLYGEGVWNPFINPLNIGGRAGVLLASGLGGRTKVNLFDYAGSTRTPTEQIDHYKVYLNKRLPMVYGLIAGVGAFNLNKTDITLPGGSPRRVKHPETPVYAEVGFGLITAQAELVVAPLLELTHGSPGAHWHVQFAFPFGRVPFGLYMAGHHFFGGGAERPLSFLLSSGFLLGSSMGISP